MRCRWCKIEENWAFTNYPKILCWNCWNYAHRKENEPHTS